MKPHLDILSASSLADFICKDSGKSTIFLGIDESLKAEPIFPSFINDITALITSNTRAVRVIPIASSLSLSRISTYWCYNTKDDISTTSGRQVGVIPLPPIDLKRLLDILPPDYFKYFDEDEKATIHDALKFAAGHPRSVEIVFNHVEEHSRMRASSTDATSSGPFESFATLVRFRTLHLPFTPRSTHSTCSFVQCFGV